jgi:hypothetical protein
VFSSEVDPGSHEENTVKQGIPESFWFDLNREGSKAHSAKVTDSCGRKALQVFVSRSFAAHKYCADPPSSGRRLKNGFLLAILWRAVKSYEIRSIGAEFPIPSPQKAMPINDFCGGCFCGSNDFCGGCFCGSRSDLAETES